MDQSPSLPVWFSFCLPPWIMQIFPSVIIGEWLFLLDKFYLLATEERKRLEGLALEALATEMPECQPIVVNLKIKFPSKKTSKRPRKKEQEISLSLWKYWFSFSITISPPKKVNKGGKIYLLGEMATWAKRKTEEQPKPWQATCFCFWDVAFLLVSAKLFLIFNFCVSPLSFGKDLKSLRTPRDGCCPCLFCSIPGVLASVGLSLGS